MKEDGISTFTTHRRTRIVQIEMNRFKQRYFKLSKNKQHHQVVLYFVDLPNYKLPATCNVF